MAALAGRVPLSPLRGAAWLAARQRPLGVRGLRPPGVGDRGDDLHRTRTPLQLWFAAAWQMTSQKHGVSAWGYSGHWTGLLPDGAGDAAPLPAAMVRPGRERLSGHVEVDEAYIGGVEDKVHGRETETKAIVAIAVEIENPKGFGRIRLGHVPDVSKESMLPFIDGAVQGGSTIHTDGWQAYLTLGERGYEHERTVMRQQSDPAHVVMPGVHRVASLLQRWLLGTHQGAVTSEHLDAYLNEFTFRFNRRLQAPRPALLPAARTGDPRRADHLPQPDRQPRPHGTQANPCDPARPRRHRGGRASSLAASARKYCPP